ncbi:MAG TPA: pirin family protein [Noviherbaspirillum sp.]|uniref:pirin family protein n=1 Tax=Noviherbaspirillum sp. TaxID=1926288 RepID=UPI002B463743|nr:pirin family protein [Noviherbaspirillum sp.]HJV85142.1 pirin family protein [Noviherbaspirillum sp.]
MNTTVTSRTLQRVIEGLATSDGAGVKLRRSLGQGQGARLDPFLMLDEFSSDNPGDYIAGFPAHPHRGFETVTYMLDGHMRHEDHLGNVGELKNGGVQWMTAGRGIIHSEMPQQEEGRMRGFQLWINLPAKEKMKPAHYRDIPPSEIPLASLPGGGSVKVIAGTLHLDGQDVRGPIQGLSTDPLYLDVALPPGAALSQVLETTHNAFIYVYEGDVQVGSESPRLLKSQSAGFLSPGERIDVKAGTVGARFLVLAGRPLREPVVQYGPFVMNTSEEIEQAIMDYQSGRFTQAAT